MQHKLLIFIFSLAAGFFLFQPAADAQENKEPFRWKAPEAGEAPVIHIGDYELFTLENGLQVILVENHKIPRVSYSLSLLNNPVLEGDKIGYVSLAGDLMGRGTTTRTKAEIDEAIDFIGAFLNTSAGGIRGSSLTKHQDNLLEVFTDVLYNPAFPQEELDKLITQEMSNLAQAKQDPGAIANNVSSVLNFSRNHPYGEVETEETIKNVSVEDCSAYYQRFFRPDNAILTIVGDINREQAEKMVTRYFAGWKKPATPLVEEELVQVNMPQSTEVAFAQKDGAVQSQIQIVYPVELGMGSPDAIKVSLMNTILGGGGFMGRLMQNLREDKAYTYGAQSSIQADEHIGSFGAYASVRNEVTDSAVVQFLYEMNRMVNEDVTEEDLRMAKSVLAGSFARGMESPQTIARFAYNTIRYNYPLDYYTNYLKNLEAVTVQDIRDMAAKYIRPDRCYIVVVGEKDDVADKLLAFDDSGAIDYFDAYGNKLDMRKADAPEDLTAEKVVRDYVDAIGGEARMKEVKTLRMVAGMNLMGQDFEMVMIRKAPGKFYQKLGNASMMLQEQVFDGQKLKMSGMGGSQVVTEGAEFEAMKREAKMFAALDYFTDEYSLELSGIEKVEGKDAYKVIATDAKGEKESLFFDLESHLMIKTVSTQSAQGQTVTVATKMSDYDTFGGVKFPRKIGIVGGAPFPINMEFTTIEVNGEVPDSTFKID